MGQQKSGLNNSRRVHITHTADTLGAPSSGDQGDCATSPTSNLLHKATLQRLRGIEDLPRTQKQMQRGSQNGETKKYTPSEEQEKSPEKEINEMEANNFSDLSSNEDYKDAQGT